MDERRHLTRVFDTTISRSVRLEESHDAALAPVRTRGSEGRRDFRRMMAVVVD